MNYKPIPFDSKVPLYWFVLLVFSHIILRRSRLEWIFSAVHNRIFFKGRFLGKPVRAMNKGMGGGIFWSNIFGCIPFFPLEITKYISVFNDLQCLMKSKSFVLAQLAHIPKICRGTECYIVLV